MLFSLMFMQWTDRVFLLQSLTLWRVLQRGLISIAIKVAREALIEPHFFLKYELL